MQLWQLDIMGSVMITDSTAAGRVTEAKLISGIDDHSRYSVIGKVVPRASARAVCTAFMEAMTEYGVPEEVLSDNGKQFTGRFGAPRPAEVLFERICRHNGITQRLTRPRSPTTSSAGIGASRMSCSTRTAPSRAWRPRSPRWMPGGWSTTRPARTSPWAWPPLPSGSPRPGRAARRARTVAPARAGPHRPGRRYS